MRNEQEDIELSPIHATNHSSSATSNKKAKNGYMSITNSDRTGYQSVDLDTSTSPTTQSVSSASPYHTHLNTSSSSASAHRGHRSREEDEQEMVRVRIELAQHTPWRAFVTHPMALCLLAANFQYVSTTVFVFYWDVWLCFDSVHRTVDPLTVSFL